MDAPVLGSTYEDANFHVFDWRFTGVLHSLDRIDVPGTAQLVEFLKKHKDDIADIFTGYDDIYILPKTNEFGEELYDFTYDKEDDSPRLCDDMGWTRDDTGKYWLWMWWD